MKELYLEKVWQIMNLLSGREAELSEQDCYISLLGNSSEYCPQEFESFLDYYSFKVDGEHIIVFNDDGIPYEDYSRNDFSYLPIELLPFGEKDLEKWIENEIESQLKQQEEQKIAEKENLKLEIERLTKKLNKYA